MTLRHYLDMIDGSALPPAWRDVLVDHATGAAPKLIRALDAHNLTLKVGHDLRTVADIQARNAERMKRLAEPCNPDYQPYAGPDDTLVLVLETGYEERVGCTVMRQYWCEDTFAAGIQKGTLFYADPWRRPPGTDFVITAETAFEIESAPIALSCGSFVQAGLDSIAFPCLIRAAFLLAFLRWRWQWLTGICEFNLAANGIFVPGGDPWVFRTLGMSRVDNGILRIEGAAQTHYGMVATRRRKFREIAFDPSYGDPRSNLGVPRMIGGAL